MVIESLCPAFSAEILKQSGARNRIGTELSSLPARLYSLAGRYDNPIPTRFLAPIDCYKIPAQDYLPVSKELVDENHAAEETAIRACLCDNLQCMLLNPSCVMLILQATPSDRVSRL